MERTANTDDVERAANTQTSLRPHLATLTCATHPRHLLSTGQRQWRNFNETGSGIICICFDLGDVSVVSRRSMLPKLSRTLNLVTFSSRKPLETNIFVEPINGRPVIHSIGNAK